MTRPAEGPGTPQREMVTLDRIRLIGLLKENPAFAGFSHSTGDPACITRASRGQRSVSSRQRDELPEEGPHQGRIQPQVRAHDLAGGVASDADPDHEIAPPEEVGCP